MSNSIKFLSSDLRKYVFNKGEDDLSLIDDGVEINLEDLDKQEAQDKMSYLNHFLDKLLDADNLVVLAGSGTSLTFNTDPSKKVAPSMWDLWEGCREDNNKLFEEILAIVNYNKIQEEKDEYGDSNPDIELLLSLCDNALTLRTLSKTKITKIENFLSSTKRLILNKTNFTNLIDEKNWGSHNKFIRALGKRGTKQQRLKLFTTNYDLAFEVAASNTGFVVIDGFDFSNPSYFNPMWYHYDIVNRGVANNEGSYIPNVIHLYKIHGSVDWRKDDKGRVKKINNINEAESLKPVFIYPSSNKYQTSYDSPYLDMMSSFLEAIKQPKTVVLCLGFGFNDKHINNALTMALRTNSEFMLMVGTKELFSKTGSFNSDIRTLLINAIEQGDGRIAMLDSTFAQFTDLLPERRKESREEQLLKLFIETTKNNA